MSGRRYNDAQAVLDTYRQLWERLERLPGVQRGRRRVGAAAEPDVRVGPDHGRRTAAAAGRGVHQRRSADRRAATTSGRWRFRCSKGRLFTEQDTRTSPRVVVIDDAMAQQLWPNEDPLGKRIRFGGIDANATAPWLTVVGVVGRVKQYTLDGDSRIALYLAHTQSPARGDERRRAHERRSRRRSPQRCGRSCARSIPTCRSTTCGRWRSGSTSRWRGGGSRCCC